jgi:hypothetical protein
MERKILQDGGVMRDFEEQHANQLVLTEE